MSRGEFKIEDVKEDEESAKKLFEDLRVEGLNPWIDKEGLRFGARWDNKLPQATVHADVYYDDLFVGYGPAGGG